MFAIKPTLARIKRAEKQAKEALEMQDKAISMHKEAWKIINSLRAERDALKLNLAPVLAYFGEQWVSDKVRKEYRKLVEFVKGEGR